MKAKNILKVFYWKYSQMAYFSLAVLWCKIYQSKIYLCVLWKIPLRTKNWKSLSQFYHYAVPVKHLVKTVLKEVCTLHTLLPDEQWKNLQRISTTQRMKFFTMDFFSKYDQIHRKLRIWSHVLKKSLMENFILCAMLLRWPHMLKVSFLVRTLHILLLNEFFYTKRKHLYSFWRLSHEYLSAVIFRLKVEAHLGPLQHSRWSS